MTKYQCAYCGKIYDDADEMIYIPKIVVQTNIQYEFHFCNWKCIEGYAVNTAIIDKLAIV